MAKDQESLPEANLTAEQMRSALPKVKLRLKELRDLEINSLTPQTYEDILNALRLKIDESLVRIFGAGTREYKKFAVYTLDLTALWLGPTQMPFSSRIAGIQKGVSSAISTLETIIALFEEQIQDSSTDVGARAIRAYENLDLHPQIARAASKLYTDTHYANAIEAAVKALNELVRLRSGLELDGSPLMERAFSPKNPVLKFNALANDSDHNEQKGFMMLFAGAVAGLRHPRAHGFVQDSPERALEFIAFVSLLAKLLDEAKL